MEEYVIVGKIVNTRGLKGEVKVVSSTSFKEERFKKGSKLVLLNPLNQESEEIIVDSYSFYKGFDYLTFKDKKHINLVEKYKNWLLIKYIKDLPVLENDMYYYHDLEGMEAYYNDQLLGQVIEVFENNNQTILRIKRKDMKDLLVLFKSDFVGKVDVEKKKLDLINIEGLL